VLTLLLGTVAVVAMGGAFADPNRGGVADTLPGGSDGAGTEAEIEDSDSETADTEVSDPEPDGTEGTDGEETSAPLETPSEGEPTESIFESEVLPNAPGESDDALPSETEEPTNGGVTNGDGGETRPTDETVDTDADTDADTEGERDTAEESDPPALRPVPEALLIEGPGMDYLPEPESEPEENFEEEEPPEEEEEIPDVELMSEMEIVISKVSPIAILSVLTEEFTFFSAVSGK
jgi:hypothetical protein